LFISAGTGNTITPVNSSQYSQDWSVFVTDATGNPVPNATITASVWPSHYAKGSLTWLSTIWGYDPNTTPATPIICSNEDTDRSGIYTSGKDANNNGVLDPGIPMTVTSSVTTDQTGSAVLTLTYPKDRANWIEAQLTITAAVSGTEAKSTSTFWLPGASEDYTSQNKIPPGAISPYGTHACNLAN
jgi:hypothetical protein